MMCVVILIHPDRANQTQHPRPKGSAPVAGIEEVILPFPKRKMQPYCCWPKSLWVLWPEISWIGLWEQNHLYRQLAGGICFQLRLLSQPPKILTSIERHRDCEPLSYCELQWETLPHCRRQVGCGWGVLCGQEGTKSLIVQKS